MTCSAAAPSRRAAGQGGAARQPRGDGAVARGDPVADGQAGPADRGRAGVGDRQRRAAVDARDARGDRAGGAGGGELHGSAVVPAEAGER